MSKGCLDIGTIQSFLDRELRPDEVSGVSEHIAGCDACALLLSQADEQNSQVFAVLDRELNALVPTQRLWTRISDTITEEKSQVPVWQKIYAFLKAGLLNPSLAVAAGSIIVVGLVFAFWNAGGAGSPDQAAVRNVSVPSVPAAGEIKTETAAVSNGTVTSASGLPEKEVKPVEVTNYSASELKQRVIRADYRVAGAKTERTFTASSPRYLPGEESFIKTIDELQRDTSAQNANMRASGQVAFQRDLALVDSSIERMRKVVQKNPRNQAARQILYSSYQDKIDLLKSASQREELVASFQ